MDLNNCINLTIAPRDIHHDLIDDIQLLSSEAMQHRSRRLLQTLLDPHLPSVRRLVSSFLLAEMHRLFSSLPCWFASASSAYRSSYRTRCSPNGRLISLRSPVHELVSAGSSSFCRWFSLRRRSSTACKFALLSLSRMFSASTRSLSCFSSSICDLKDHFFDTFPLSLVGHSRVCDFSQFNENEWSQKYNICYMLTPRLFQLYEVASIPDKPPNV